MTVSNTTVKESYSGNGSTTTFAIPFSFQETTEIVVWLRDETDSDNPTQTLQVLTTNYTLDPAGDSPTNVIMNTPPSATQILVIIRATPNTQATDYLETGEFPAESHEDALDKAIQRIQEIEEKLTRVPILPITTQIASLPLPEPDPTEVFTWNGGGTAIVYTEGGAGGSGGGALEVRGSPAAPVEVTAAGGITYASNQRELVFIDSDGGAIDVSANPQIQAGNAGVEMILVGTSDTDTVLLENGDGLKLNGSMLLGDSDVLYLTYDGTNWVEIARNN